MASEDPTVAGEGVADKGKGKDVNQNPDVQDTAMDEDDSSSSSDEGENENENGNDQEEEDGMEEIDLNNIVEGGRRTRGRVIDFAKAAEQNPPQDDEDDDEDDDFKAPEDNKVDKGDKMDTS